MAEPASVMQTPTTPSSPASTTAQPTTSKLFSEDTLKAYPSLSKFSDAESLGKSYGEMEKLSGRSLRIPGEDAKPEEWSAFYSKLGRPEKADGYEFKAPEGLPEGMGAIPEATMGAFKNLAHQLGLTPKQAQGLYEFVHMDAKASFEGKAAAARASEEALRKEWGDGFDKNMALAQRAFSELADGDKDITEFMRETGAHQDPRIIKFFSRLGAALDEDSAVTPGDEKGSGANQASAMEEIVQIRNDKDHPFHHPNKIGHKEAVAKMRQLYEIAYPNS